MEGRGKRMPAVFRPPHQAKRCKTHDGTSKRCPLEVSMAADSSIFVKSSTPARFMFLEQGEWKDFLHDTLATLMAAFQARRSSVEFSLHGSRYLLSFTDMLQWNLLTGFCRSIAWIDIEGQHFSPVRYIEGYGIPHLQLGKNNRSNPSGIVSISAQSFKFEDVVAVGSPGLKCQQSPLDINANQQSCIAHEPNSSASASLGYNQCDGDVSSDSAGSSSTICSSNSVSDVTSNLRDADVHTCGHIGSLDFPLLQDKLVRFKEIEPEFLEVKNRFMSGLSMLSKGTTVMCISKVCHQSPSGHMRHKAFKQQEEFTERIRGDANIRYGWYSTSKQGVSSVILHGFGQPKTPRDGFGAGIYLSSEKYAFIGAVYSDIDENGVQHAVLCRVIMGHMEQVSRGSVQFHPSSEDYDGGVDDLGNPTRYIVWSTHMNTHILPEYIVSFKLATPWHVKFAEMKNKQKASGKLSRFGCRCSGPLKLESAEPRPRCAYSLPPESSCTVLEMFFWCLKSYVSAEIMDSLQQLYNKHKDGTLSSSDLITNARLIAGDHHVHSAIKSMQTHLSGGILLQTLLATRAYGMADINRVA